MLDTIRKMTLAFLLVGLSWEATAKRYEVTLPEVASCLETAIPGDQIYIKDGHYRDMQLRWKGQGTEAAPITIEALHPGGVTIGGESTLRIAGEWVSIAGLHFTEGHAPKGAVVEFRDGKQLAYNCRLTNCAITDYNPPRRDMAYSYILLYGRGNRVDHCSLTGKLNLGVTLIVMLNDERCLENYHRIDHNYFGERPVYGSNGAETIRIGTSQQAYSSSRTILEENLFERCSGEVEVVSIKSSDNIVCNNVLWECEGVVALRHGDRNTVHGNLFVGNGRRNTGGIRVVNAGHRIYDNVLMGLAGSRFFSALAVMNGVPNSLPNRYCQVQDVEIYRNIFVECSNIEFGTGKDLERTLAPEKVLFANNIIIHSKLTEPYQAIDQTDGIRFENNILQLPILTSLPGFISKKQKPRQIPEIATLRNNRGAAWIEKKQVPPLVLSSGTKQTVEPDSDLTAMVRAAKPGSTLLLAPGTYTIQCAIWVDKPLVIDALDTAHRPLIRFNGESPDNMVSIADGARLILKNLIFDGSLEAGKVLAKAGVSTIPEMIKPYALTIEGCEFRNFGEGGFFAVKGTKDTFAERVVIRNSLFRDLSGDAINYAAEKDDVGRYNAEEVLIENCSFHRILGLPINIYRDGSDESTAGPYVDIRHCNFTDCCNKERGSVIRLIGPQVLSVECCNFDNSGRGGATIRLDEATWEKVRIANCNLWNAGKLITTTPQALQGKMYNVEPIYIGAERYDYSPEPNSELYRLGIGLKK